MTESRVLELQAGAGEPASMEFREGVQMLPLGIGSGGAWRVKADRILDIHAYIYFDGSALFVQSADERHPVLVNGRAIGRAWTPVDAPSTLSLGGAQLVFRPSDLPFSSTSRDDDSTITRGEIPPDDDDDRTVAGVIPRDIDATLNEMTPNDQDRTIAAPVPSPRTSGPSVVVSPPAPSPAQRPFAPGAFAHAADDRESTRYQPIAAPAGQSEGVGPLGETPAMGAPSAAHLGFRAPPVRPAAGVRWDTQPPADGPTNDLQEDLSTLPKDLLKKELGSEDLVSATPITAPPAQLFASPPGGPTIVQPIGRPPTAQPMAPMGPPPGLLNVPPPAPPPPVKETPFLERVKKEWKETPPLKKVLFFLMPLMLPVVWFTFGDEPPAARPHVGASPSASALQAGTGAAAPSGFPPGYPPLATSAPTVTAPTAPPPPPPPPPPPSAVALETNPPPRTRPSPTVDPRLQSPPEPAASAAPIDRREHQAADLVATGQYEQAAALYDQLATERPENPAFHEAARILRAKLDAGVR